MVFHATPPSAGTAHPVLAFTAEPPAGGGHPRVFEIDVPATDLEELLNDSEGFLVDGPDDEPIGVVEGVEREGAGGAVSALLLCAGWFGRKHLRVDRDAIEAVLPGERRIIVREARLLPPDRTDRS
jgi:hypothetical protein